MTSLSIAAQGLHLLPPLVGLVLLLRTRARGTWRLFGLAFVVLSLLGSVAAIGWTVAVTTGSWRPGSGGLALLGVVNFGLSLLSFVAAMCAVAAIVLDRGGSPDER